MFLVLPDHQVLDYDLDFLKDLADFLDGRLEAVALGASRCPDPDAFGFFDTAEYIAGVGFIACQLYLAATYGSVRLGKAEALRLGPAFRSGTPVVALINHAANFAKHSPEWSSPQARSAGQRTLDGLGELDLSEAQSMYPLTSVLTVLVAPKPARFRSLIPVLESWRDVLPGA